MDSLGSNNVRSSFFFDSIMLAICPIFVGMQAMTSMVGSISSSAERQHLKAITSIRFFFAVAVFLHHIPLAVEPVTKSQSFLTFWLFQEGFIGVSFFFILSGFILSYSYSNWQENIAKASVIKFWRNRFARIYPLHLATLILSTVFYFQSADSPGFHPILAALSNLTLTQSFIPLRSIYFSYNVVSWSISDETFFYLLFPFLLPFISRKRAATLLLIILILIVPILSLTYPTNNPHYYYYIFPVVRLVDFAIGISLFNIWKSIRANVRLQLLLAPAALLVTLSSFLVHDYVPIALRYSAFYWPTCCLIILACANSNNWLSRMLSNRAFLYLGKISFAFYLVHFIIIQGYNSWMRDNLQLGYWGTITMLLGVTTVAAALLHEIIEEPFNKWLRKG